MLNQGRFVDRAAAGGTTRKYTLKVWSLIVAGLCVASSLLIRTSDAGEDAAPETWQLDFEKAEAFAKEQRVPLLIHFHAHWCGPCRTMESEVLETAEVREALRSGIVGVKVNADDRRDLVSRFSISALPTDVIVSPGGHVLSQNAGSPGRKVYVARLVQFSVPATGQTGLKETVAAKTADRSAKTPGNQVSQTQVSDMVAEPSIPVESVIVSLEGTAAGKSNANGLDAAAATISQAPAGMMTKALRRESDRRVGLDGYSPVSLTETETWQSGDAQFKHEFQGVSYQLSSAEELERFKATPERFVPALHGCDPVAFVNNQTVQAGHIELGVTWRSRVYFFYSKKSRDEFLNNPHRFVRTKALTFFRGETPG